MFFGSVVRRTWFKYRSKWKFRNTFTVDPKGDLVKKECVKVLQNVAFEPCRRSSSKKLMKRIRDDRVLDEDLKWDNGQRGLVGGFEHDGAAGAGLLNLEPASSTDTPAIAGLKPCKTELRHGCREVVAERLRYPEKLLVDDAADGVDAKILRPRLAAARAVEAGHGLTAADFERLAENVSPASFDWFLNGFGAGHCKLSGLILVRMKQVSHFRAEAARVKTLR